MRKPILTALLAFSLPLTAHMTEHVVSQVDISKYNIRMELQNKVNEKLSYNVLSHIPVSSPLRPATINRISDLYGRRECHPVLKTPSFHTGIDFSANKGTPVLSTANGTVVDVTYSNLCIGYGSRISGKSSQTSNQYCKRGWGGRQHYGINHFLLAYTPLKNTPNPMR